MYGRNFCSFELMWTTCVAAGVSYSTGSFAYLRRQS